MKCIAQNTRKPPGKHPRTPRLQKDREAKQEGRFAIAATEAQKRASAKYQREKTKQVNLKFSPNEMDLFDWLKAQDAPVSTTVKRLIREEIDRTA